MTGGTSAAPPQTLPCPILQTTETPGQDFQLTLLKGPRGRVHKERSPQLLRTCPTPGVCRGHSAQGHTPQGGGSFLPSPSPRPPHGLLPGDLRNCPREIPVVLREELLERLKPFLSLLLHLGIPRWGSRSPLGRQGHPQAPGPSWRHRGRALLARGACHLLGTWGLWHRHTQSQDKRTWSGISGSAAERKHRWVGRADDRFTTWTLTPQGSCHTGDSRC